MEPLTISAAFAPQEQQAAVVRSLSGAHEIPAARRPLTGAHVIPPPAGGGGPPSP
jgi:hypothetical protein